MAFQEPRKWVEWLPAAEWWYNSSHHTSIKPSPFEALYGYVPPQVGEISIPCHVSEEAQVTIQEQIEMLKKLQHNLSQAHAKMKKYADMKRTERRFQEGDVVYLKMQPYRENALGLRNALKLNSKYYGPFKILQKIGRVAYNLLLPQDAQIHDVFHVNQLKKHLGPSVVPNAKHLLIT